VIEKKGSLTNACTQTGLASEGEGGEFDIMAMSKGWIGTDAARLVKSTRTAGTFFNPNETGAQIQYTYGRPDTQAELLHWWQWPRGAIWFPAAMICSLAAHASQRV
jgi:hypothetical protein